MAPTAAASGSKSRGPIKSERNRAAVAASSSAASASSSNSAFHKRRAQGQSSHHGHNASSSNSNQWRRPQQSAQIASRAEKSDHGAGRRLVTAPQAEQEDDKSDDGDGEDEQDEDVRSKTALSMAGHPLPPLASLVDALSQFSYLQRLDLSSLEPSEASPRGLETLTWLAKAVFRSKASAKGKARAFGDNLTWLNLSSNSNLTSEACIGLEALEELCVLTLSHCALTSLPPSINPLRNLKALVLNNNAITGLPQAFPHLPELNSLILSHNEITQLPASLPASLPALKKLSLGHNKLQGSQSLPDFSLCLALREVRLNDNPHLGALPRHVKDWGKGADGRTAPGLELLELKDCGLNTWESLSTLVEVEDGKESQPRLRRKGLTQLLLKGNGVADEDDYKDKILNVHPTLRVLDNERLQPRVKPADRDDEVAQGADVKKAAKKSDRVQRGRREVQANVSEDEEDDDAAAQMAADMRALRRGRSDPEPANDDDDGSSDDDEAAQMAAEMRALRRGQATPAKSKPNKDAARTNKQQKPSKVVSQKTVNVAAEDDDRSKPKHKRGARAGKKVNKSSDSDAARVKDTKKAADSTDQSRGFFEQVDADAEKARLAPLYELSKKRAKIASGRTEVAEGVLEDATSALSKARQKESKGRTELDTFDDTTPVEGARAPSKKKTHKDGAAETPKVNTSVAGIIDLRKPAEGKEDGDAGKKRKANQQDGAGKKKAKSSLPFAPMAAGPGKATTTDSFGSGGDAWGADGAWA